MSLTPLLGILSEDDYAFVHGCLGSVDRIIHPDLTIAPDGTPYIYRWHVIPRTKKGNWYLHIQVADDPERPLHDHPWDNQSVIVSGGYKELYVPYGIMTDYDAGPRVVPAERMVMAGRTVHRRAEEAHRLILAAPYTISLFSTGPVVRDWGFWLEQGWRSHADCIVQQPDGRSIFMEPSDV